MPKDALGVIEKTLLYSKKKLNYLMVRIEEKNIQRQVQIMKERMKISVKEQKNLEFSCKTIITIGFF